MKRLSLILALSICITLLLPGCTKTQGMNSTNMTAGGSDETTVEEVAGKDAFTSEELLAFPNLAWDMGPKEIVAALELSNAGYTYDSDRLVIPEIECFGAVADNLVILFDSTSFGMYPYLIYVLYPEDADMAAVKAELTKQYGAPAEDNKVYSPGAWDDLDQDGASEYYEVQNGLPYIHTFTDDHNAYWISSVHKSDYLGQAGLEQYYTEISDLPEEIYCEFVNSQVVSTIFWTDDYGNEQDNFEENKNVVQFSAVGNFLRIDECLATLDG